MVWLCADMDDQDRSIVSTLWCVVCRKYETRMCGLKNFSRAWIDGSSNHKMSNVTDHANSEQHKSAMIYLHKDQAKSRNEPITSYSPVARSLLSAPMDQAVRELQSGPGLLLVSGKRVWGNFAWVLVLYYKPFIPTQWMSLPSHSI